MSKRSTTFHPTLNWASPGDGTIAQSGELLVAAVRDMPTALLHHLIALMADQLPPEVQRELLEAHGVYWIEVKECQHQKSGPSTVIH